MGFGGNQGFDRGVYILVFRVWGLGFRVKAAVRYCLDGFYKGAFDAQSWDLISLSTLQLCVSTLVQFPSCNLFGVKAYSKSKPSSEVFGSVCP